jgi:hypothetical protein
MRRVTAHLGLGDEETSEYTIVERGREWGRLNGGGGGWTSVDAFCPDVCQELLDVATFTNDVLALTAGKSRRDAPTNVTREANAMSDQLAALVSAVLFADLGDEKRHSLALDIAACIKVRAH